MRFWFMKDNGQRDLQLIVAGPDIDVDQRHRQPARQRDADDPVAREPDLDRRTRPAGIAIEPRRQVAADLGVSTEALSTTIRVATLGDIDANLAKFNAGDRLIPIRVELDEAARGRIGVLQNLRVPTGGGGTTPLVRGRRFLRSATARPRSTATTARAA